MRTQLPASSQPPPQRLLRRGYQRLLAGWFGGGKVGLSHLLNLFRRKAPWPSYTISWRSLDEYARLLPKLVIWQPDPLGGAIDTFYNREIIAAKYRQKGVFAKDCDGLALFSAYNLELLLRQPAVIYVVTVILDPFSFAKSPLLYAAHVICVFRHEGAWRVISNDTLYAEPFESLAAAVQHNPYCAQHPVLWFEVRNTSLKRLHAGRQLQDFRPDA
ncbi:MAG: hypothetical protein GXP37_08880 [Chloroflexi bacterium]|nr:hypothetical protein [Chloroflexota bacterium]